MDTAQSWYEKAAKQGMEKAQAKIDEINKAKNHSVVNNAVPNTTNQKLPVKTDVAEILQDEAIQELPAVKTEVAKIPQNEAKSSDFLALGNKYLEGDAKTPSDAFKALLYYEKAANQDSTEAMYKLAFMYERGIAVSLDLNKAFQLELKAASKGHVLAKYGVATKYELGKGVVKNTSQANMWYQKFISSDPGDSPISDEVMVLVGIMYYEGKGVTRDYMTAFDIFSKAASNAVAQTYLGHMYRYAKGVPLNDKTAFELYQKAAYQGNAEAQRSLGIMYNAGKGCQRDPVKAAEWAKRAIANKNK